MGYVTYTADILEQAFLRPTFCIILFFFRLPYFFHQVTFAVAMKQWLITVFAKLCSYVSLV